MANTIRIKRRASGSSGAPASLKNAELAFNEVDQKLYYGKGVDGNGDATQVIAIGGVGWDATPDLSGYGQLASSNSWSGVNTFSSDLNVTGTLKISNTAVTATAAELNILDGVTADYAEINLLDTAQAGVVVNSKAVIYGASGEVNMTTLKIGGTAVTATAAELNILDGVTADYAEINLLDTAIAGTIVNSKAVIYGASGEVNMTTLKIAGSAVTADAAELNLLDTAQSGVIVNSKAVVYGASGEVNMSTLKLSGTAVTADAAELNLLDTASAGTIVNSKAVVYGASGQVNAAELQVSGVAITATPAELNTLDGITASTAELNILDGVTADYAELNLLDTAQAGTIVASKAVIYGASGQVVASSMSAVANVNVGGDLTVTGNLTVNGSTVTVNVETVEVEDKNILLGKVATPTDTTADGGGITLKGATDKEFKWVDATDAWTSSEHVALAAGKDLIMSGATSGAVTVVVADVAGSNTVTLPAATGTVVLDSTVCTAIASCSLDGGTF